MPKCDRATRWRIPGVKILLAGITYDVIVLNEAYKNNCPLVSRAGYSAKSILAARRLAMWPAPTELLRDKHLRSAPSPLSDVSCCFLDVSNKRRAPQDSEVIYQICSRVHAFGPYVVF